MGQLNSRDICRFSHVITTDLQDGVDGGGGGAVEGGEGDAIVAAVLEQLDDVLSGEDAGGDDPGQSRGARHGAGGRDSGSRGRKRGKMGECVSVTQLVKVEMNFRLESQG